MKTMFSFETWVTKVPFIIYADFEAIIEKMQSTKGNPQKSYTEKTSQHTTCGNMYKLVKSNGEATETKLYHRENALEEFLKLLFQEEERIREELRKVVPIKMIGKISTLQPIATSVKSLR